MPTSTQRLMRPERLAELSADEFGAALGGDRVDIIPPGAVDEPARGLRGLEPQAVDGLCGGRDDVRARRHAVLRSPATKAGLVNAEGDTGSDADVLNTLDNSRVRRIRRIRCFISCRFPSVPE